MSNETDLDWLARNVHVWKSGCDLAVVQRGGGEIYVTWPSACSCGITKQQWLARRAELQNKPSWDDFGESAKFMAQDSDGAWMAFEIEPTAKSHVWSAMRGWCGYAREGSDRCCGEVLGDWRGTLEKRPEQAAFTPFTSIEDNQEKGMAKQQEVSQDNGWFERGELPPVGEVCDAYLDYPPQWIETEIVAHKDGFAIGWCKSVMKGCHGDKAHEFRPLRTERDKLVELIKTYRHTFRSDTEFADAILAAGFKRGAA